MDFCQHPEYQGLHGMTQSEGVPLSGLVPLFTFAKMTTHSDILVTPLEQVSHSHLYLNTGINVNSVLGSIRWLRPSFL